jgi:glycosyltransferase involved in cell wall biosynthesis
MTGQSAERQLSARRIRLAIVSTHPIQYYAPVFRALARSEAVMPRVFYTWSQTSAGPVFDREFGKRFSWDIPLLEGYEHVFVPNVAKRPGSNHFSGIDNPELIARISQWEADAVLIYGWNLRSHLGAIRYFKGRIPVLFRGDSTLLDPQSPWRKRVRRLYLRWVYSHVDIAIAVGQNSRDYFIWSGLSPERVAFAPHCIDTIRFGDAEGKHAALALRWREELGIRAGAVTFVFAAKLIPKKDPELLLDAFLALRSNAHLVLCGDGELGAALRARAAGHDNVHFLPFQNQTTMPAVYRLGDVFVLPSRGPGETWGLSLNEAMASARTVIASSRAGGARDLVRESVTGWTFASGDQRDLERALSAALACGAAGLRNMGKTCNSLIRSLWSTETSAEAIAVAALNAVAARNANP